MLSEFGSEGTTEQAILDLVRVKQFRDHDLTHVCHCRGPFYGCLSFGFSTIAEVDTDYVSDEEAEIILQLDRTMEDYSKNLPGRLQEIRIGHLSLTDADNRIGENMSNVTADKVTAFPSSSKTTENKTSTPISGSQIDTNQDNLVDIFSDFQSDNLGENWAEEEIKLYFEWLEYYYHHQNDFSTPTLVDENWYLSRRAFVSRLASALKQRAKQPGPDVRLIVEEDN